MHSAAFILSMKGERGKLKGSVGNLKRFENHLFVYFRQCCGLSLKLGDMPPRGETQCRAPWSQTGLK